MYWLEIELKRYANVGSIILLKCYFDFEGFNWINELRWCGGSARHSLTKTTLEFFLNDKLWSPVSHSVCQSIFWLSSLCLSLLSNALVPSDTGNIWLFSTLGTQTNLNLLGSDLWLLLKFNVMISFGDHRFHDTWEKHQKVSSMSVLLHLFSIFVIFWLDVAFSGRVATWTNTNTYFTSNVYFSAVNQSYVSKLDV